MLIAFGSRLVICGNNLDSQVVSSEACTSQSCIEYGMHQRSSFFSVLLSLNDQIEFRKKFSFFISANMLLENMNLSYDPCKIQFLFFPLNLVIFKYRFFPPKGTDFYNYNCGNFLKDRPIPDSEISVNQFKLVQNQTSLLLKGI